MQSLVKADAAHGVLTVTIDREDKRTNAYVGANYLFNRNLGFTVAYDYLKQDSVGAAAGQSYEDNRISLSSSVQF